MVKKAIEIISLGFDVNQIIPVPLHLIGCFKIGEISTTLDFNYRYYEDKLQRNLYAKTFVISIDRSLKDLNVELAGEAVNKDTEEAFNYIQLLQAYHNIILNVRFHYDDGNKTTYHFDWGIANECINPYQRVKTNKHGDIFIAVSKDTDLLDKIFPDKHINADDYSVGCEFRNDKDRLDTLLHSVLDDMDMGGM